MMDLRTKRVANSMEGIQEFRKLWDRGTSYPAPAAAREVSTSPFQNINAGGLSGGLYAPTFTPHHERFDAVIEPLVKPLVHYVVRELRLITYTSCQGHSYPGWNDNSELHVGILPRSASEAFDIGRMLESRLNGRDNFDGRSVSYDVCYGELLDKNDRSRFPVIDLYLSKSPPDSWDHYMASRENSVASMLQALRGRW